MFAGITRENNITKGHYA